MQATAGVGVMWITFMYGEMNRDSWQSQSIWMQGFMYSKVLSTFLCTTADPFVCLMHAAADHTLDRHNVQDIYDWRYCIEHCYSLVYQG